ncbi:hypothetical protein Gorai_003449, partial [Gossypium raimondii]|nr:hypothetical protein [Gossypium raimondii]
LRQHLHRSAPRHITDLTNSNLLPTYLRISKKEVGSVLARKTDSHLLAESALDHKT